MVHSTITGQQWNQPDISRLRGLTHSRSLLRHLIYAVEHDRTLNVSQSNIILLKEQLQSIEQQLSREQVLEPVADKE